MTTPEQPLDVRALSVIVQDMLDECARNDGVLLLTGQGPDADRVELVYDERVTSIQLGELGVDLRLPGVDEQMLSTAVHDWYMNRPVCDAEAATRGVAVLTDCEDGQIAWQTVVSRGSATIPWAPSPWLSKDAVMKIRKACVWRSGLVVAAPVRRDNTAVWNAIPPTAGTAVLTNPERMISQMRQIGLYALDPCAVVSSAGTVVAAEREAAHRLAEQVSAPVVHVLPLREPARYQWR